MCDVGVQDKEVYVLIDGISTSVPSVLNTKCIEKCGSSSILCKKRKALIAMLKDNY